MFQEKKVLRAEKRIMHGFINLYGRAADPKSKYANIRLMGQYQDLTCTCHNKPADIKKNQPKIREILSRHAFIMMLASTEDQIQIEGANEEIEKWTRLVIDHDSYLKPLSNWAEKEVKAVMGFAA